MNTDLKLQRVTVLILPGKSKIDLESVVMIMVPLST